ncbi:MAG TPA: hypothetical protein VK918_03215, partial [Pyrinomonadaceae bacterium]|nr:hypothetical protein [Pyrinomonadaceae bacterium]
MGQVVAFLYLYGAAVEFYILFHGPIRNDLQYGLSLHFSHYVLGGLAAANAIAQIFAERNRTKWLAAMNAALLWNFYWAGIGPQMPNRFLLVSVAGIVSFALAMVFLYRIPTHSVV